MALVYIYGECLGCKKPINWTVHGGYMDYYVNDHEIPITLQASLIGATVVCGKCGTQNTLRDNDTRDGLEVYKYVVPTPRVSPLN